jgi:medium-chain acyl-[acyl-carrier-protein] hydrolase
VDAYTDEQRRWLKRFGPRDAARIRLLCFHGAGGTAMMFRQWHRLLPDVVEPVAVQLPGRLGSWGEAPYESMDPLVRKLADVLAPFLDQPFACYGWSMGARVAWRLTHLLRDRGLPLPRALYLACNVAPGAGPIGQNWNLSDDRLIEYLRELGGTPPEVLREGDLRTALLSVLRADLRVIATDTFGRHSPLDIPVRAFAGSDDAESPPGHMSRWQDETRAGFSLDIVPGGHFFSPAGLRQVITVLTGDLLPAEKESSRSPEPDTGPGPAAVTRSWA